MFLVFLFLTVIYLSPGNTCIIRFARRDVLKLDTSKFLGTWHGMYLSPKKYKKLFSCETDEFAKLPDGNLATNISLILNTDGQFHNMTGRFRVRNGNILYLTYLSTSLDQPSSTIISQVLATDYENYYIVKTRDEFSINDYMYGIAFRSTNPDEKVLEAVKKDLKKNGLDFNNFAKYWENC